MSSKERKKNRKKGKSENYNIPHCIGCGSKNCSFVEDPYSSEINGDYTKYWLCDNCYNESCEDI